MVAKSRMSQLRVKVNCDGRGNGRKHSVCYVSNGVMTYKPRAHRTLIIVRPPTLHYSPTDIRLPFFSKRSISENVFVSNYLRNVSKSDALQFTGCFYECGNKSFEYFRFSFIQFQPYDSTFLVFYIHKFSQISSSYHYYLTF